MEQSQCLHCRHALLRADRLEVVIPGLNILSSAYGSVRGETGLCRRHDKFITARSTCADFESRAALSG